MYPRYVRDIEVESALRRSRIEAQISQTRLKRQKIDADRRLDDELRRSRRQMEIADTIQMNLRRSRAQDQIVNERLERQAVLRRSRMDAEIQAERRVRQNILLHSRMQADQRADKLVSALAKSRLESALQLQRLDYEKMIRNSKHHKY